jgi:hypothetical protein
VLAEASLVAALAANDWSRTVFLHVRRGDYLSPANQHHHVDLVGYYREALALVGGFIGSKGRDGVCFVVSDDIEWCQRVLFDQIRDAWNGAWLWCPAELSDAETLYWTSMCARGGICANSTFSWWAAYFLWRQFGDAATLVMPRPWGKPPMPDRRDLYPAWATVLGPV